MKILITGGTGFIGRPLVRTLATDGHEVVVLSRRATPPAGWVTGATFVTWPGPASEIPDKAVNGAGAIINLAGESLGESRWANARKDRLFGSRIETTRHLVAAIRRAPAKPKVLISASAVGYYGPHGDEELTESSPPGNDFLAVLCSHWEEEAKAVIKLGVRLVLLRTGLVLEKDGGALPRMLLPFKLFAGGPVGSGRQVYSWIHRDDVIGLIRFALSQNHVSGPINLTAPHPVTNREFAHILGRVMRRPSFFPTPGFILRLALGEMSSLVLTGQRVIPRQALQFGYEFKYRELEDALRSILS